MTGPAPSGGIDRGFTGRRPVLSRCRQGASAVLAGADLAQPAADGGPADAPDGERDFADGYDVADGQGPQPPFVILAGQLRASGVSGVAVGQREGILGDRLREPPVCGGLVG